MAHLPKPHCLWQGDIDVDEQALAPLRSNTHCDVAVVGGGFTGLWTALALKAAAPKLDVRILEARTCGHGASGRNGGWFMGSLEGLHQFADHQGQLSPEVLELLRELIPSALAQFTRLNIDCDVVHGGAVFAAARYPQQQARAQSFLQEQRALGFTSEDYYWLSARETAARVNAQNTSGGVFTPHIATLNPWKLIRGMAHAAQRCGITIHENSKVTKIATKSGKQPRLETQFGRLTADWLVLATEGYSEGNNPLHPYILPIQSGMVATEPLTEDQWRNLGFHQREAFCDFSRASTYLQRSADNRLVIGARGSYAFGRRCQHSMRALNGDTVRRQRLALELFPQLNGVDFTHAWGGTLGIPRRFRPHINIDRRQGLATAGGYIGEGVGASFLFGRTLADLILERTSQETTMPWVREAPLSDGLRRWEPEPLPWLGFNATMMAFDVEERLLRRPPA